MHEHDTLKAEMIADVMASTGCSVEQAERLYAAVEQRILKPTITLLTGIVMRKLQRERFGVDTIANN